MSDPVKDPSHYKGNGIECKEALRSMLSDTIYCIQPEANDGDRAKNIPPIGFYWWGCAFKYLWRWSHKGGVQDIDKAIECLTELRKAVSE